MPQSVKIKSINLIIQMTQFISVEMKDIVAYFYASDADDVKITYSIFKIFMRAKKYNRFDWL